MATRTTVTLVDDIDGGTAEETVGFGLDGAAYEIDLSTTNAGELRAALERYVAAARRTGGRRSTGNATPSTPATSRASAPSSSSRERSQEIRAWADEHGAGLSSRGRIPSSVVEAFEAGDPSRLNRADGASAAAPEPAPEPEPTPEPEPSSGSAPAADEEPRGRDGLTAGERERIRAWAVDEGIEVKARGQLKKDLIANYQAWAARQS